MLTVPLHADISILCLFFFMLPAIHQDGLQPCLKRLGARLRGLSGLVPQRPTGSQVPSAFSSPRKHPIASIPPPPPRGGWARIQPAKAGTRPSAQVTLWDRSPHLTPHPHPQLVRGQGPMSFRESGKGPPASLPPHSAGQPAVPRPQGWSSAPQLVIKGAFKHFCPVF